jgi:hypothetical protein
MDSNEREKLIDRWLDEALKQCGSVEPRWGLEDRVLATLRTESERIPSPIWSSRPAWIMLATVVVAALLIFTWRTRAMRETVVTPPQHKLPVPVGTTSPATDITARTSSPHHRLPSPATDHISAKNEALPRLDQFPSPQPLSEQEQMLARYVQQFPRQAVLMARAQTTLFQQEELMQQMQPEVDRPEDADTPNQ